MLKGPLTAWKKPVHGSATTAPCQAQMRRIDTSSKRSVASFCVQRFAPSDIGRVVMDPVSLLAATLLGTASLPPDAAMINVNPSQRAAHVVSRISRNGGHGARCKHGTSPATPPAVATQRQAGGSAPPDMADPAGASPIPVLILSGHGRRRIGERDGPTPIPLLLLTQSFLI
jgi:hypothetical protein